MKIIACLIHKRKKRLVFPSYLASGSRFSVIFAGVWSINYYGQFYKSAMNPLFLRLNYRLEHGVERKVKRCRRHNTRVVKWLRRIWIQNPLLFAHWRFGVTPLKTES